MEYSTLLPPIQRLHSQVPKNRTLSTLIRTLFGSGFPKEKYAKSLTYIYLTRLLWEYIAETLPPELHTIKEPHVIHARQVTWKKRIVTQELARAIIDYHAITSTLSSPLERVVMYGAQPWHLSYVFINQRPTTKFVIVDTLAALQTARDHFVHAFPEKSIWMCPPFGSFDQIQEQFAEASICLIQPSYLAHLPDGCIDLGVMIDMLDQLDQDEIEKHFAQVTRLIKKYIYFRQNKKGRLREADYLIPEVWEEVFWRTCPLFPLSFEALFEK